MPSYYNIKVIVLALVFSNCNSFPFPKTELEAGVSSSFIPEKKFPHFEKKVPHKGTGPLSPDILKQNPRLELVGNFEGINFYIERTPLTWDEGRAFCESLNLIMAYATTQDMRDFLYNNLPDSDGKVWTSGKSRHGAEWPKLYWNIGTVLVGISRPEHYFYELAAEDALVLEVDSTAAWPNRLGIYSPASKFYTLCMFPGEY